MPDIKPPAPVTEAEKREKKGENTGDLTLPKKKKGGVGKVLLIIIILVVIILVGLYLVSKYTSYNVLNINKANSTVSDKPSGWHAIFLSNGQVYFGKIAKRSDDNIILTDIYYLQVTTQIQPADQEAQQQQQQQNVSLVKLGNELHGPRDAMMINMTHVLFTEELKQDSRVVDAINRYLEENQ